jgi:hypothetical protein
VPRSGAAGAFRRTPSGRCSQGGGDRATGATATVLHLLAGGAPCKAVDQSAIQAQQLSPEAAAAAGSATGASRTTGGAGGVADDGRGRGRRRG